METHTGSDRQSEPRASHSEDDSPAHGSVRRKDAGVDPQTLSILVVSSLGSTTKTERHWGPLADVAGEVTMVCLDSDQSVDGIRYRRVPAPFHRVVGIAAMFVVASYECFRGEYDAIASISLVPYGSMALVVGRLFGLPVHLGIIGADLDSHAVSWYGPLVRAAFRRFDAVSVPGSSHRRRLVELGVSVERAHILTNAIETDRFRPERDGAAVEYDFVWLGRFSPEKDPLLFVRALAELRDRGLQFDAVMAGSGTCADAVARERSRLGLEDALALPGWVEEPRSYYTRSRVYVLSSRRDALPMTLLEAMAMGVPGVAPDVGSVSDVVKHRETGLLVEERTPQGLAAALQLLLEDDDLRSRLAENAQSVRRLYSYDAARQDWRAIVTTLSQQR